jgi:hypothetical protein
MMPAMNHRSDFLLAGPRAKIARSGQVLGTLEVIQFDMGRERRIGILIHATVYICTPGGIETSDDEPLKNSPSLPFDQSGGLAAFHSRSTSI